ncbi:hypothetical protein BVX98_07480 [bacterium F11]|nr:hypothetical protein BVX98_07480 [bacterium F11]
MAVPQPVLNLQDSFSQVVKRVKPAVVNITSVRVETIHTQPYEFFFGDPFEDFFGDFFGERYRSPRKRPAPRQYQRKHEGMGSGVIVDPRGYVLTNEHVISGAQDITVRLSHPKEKEYKAKVIGKDPYSDLAVLKIKSGKDLPYVPLGDSDEIEIGDWVIAVGSPFGLEQTVTAGIISAVRQTLNIEGRTHNNMIQTDAAINRGNSGGPLVNLKGEVIGINTAIYAPTGVFAGIGFAIPSNRVKDITDELLDKGKVVRGWMGVEIGKLDEVMAQQFDVPEAEGVLINRVMEDSPAEDAGLERGDVVIEFDGKKVLDPSDLQRLVAKSKPDKKVKIKIIRNGKEKIVTMTTGERPAMEAEVPEKDTSEPEEWEGAKLSNLSPALAKRYGLPSKEQGVIVLNIKGDGLAAEVGLYEGDLIISVNQKKTPDIKTFKRYAKKIDIEKGVLFDINRQERRIYLSYQRPN